MTEDDVRALVRAAIQRHLSAQDPGQRIDPPKLAGYSASEGGRRIDSLAFSQYRLERAPDDTMCIIEPVVRCNHCGFCKCHGH